MTRFALCGAWGESSSAISSMPGNLELAQVGGTASFGEDITIQATTSTPGYTIWIDATENILASDDLTFDGSDYEWPNDAVTSSVSSETGITKRSLNSLPRTNRPVRMDLQKLAGE